MKMSLGISYKFLEIAFLFYLCEKLRTATFGMNLQTAILSGVLGHLLWDGGSAGEGNEELVIA
jgi:hypothetical protein